MSELNIYQNQPYPTEPMLSVSVEWVTQISENRSGKENRIPKITEPQYSIEGSDFVLKDEDFAVFVQAFINAEGKNNAFPFKCPLDYYCTKDGESYDSASFQRGILVPIDSLNYQIVKQYRVGAVNAYKTITLPVEGTIHVYVNDTEVFPTVNLSTGVVTFASPPTGTLTVDCEFRLPMRFDIDDNQLNQIKRAVNSIYSANDTSLYLAVNFRLLEDMNYERKAPLISGDWTGNINYDFDGHPLADIAYSDRSLTRIQSSDNKRELRDGLGVFRKKYAIANNNMNWNATQRYFNLFMACKGRLLPFTFENQLNQLVRLDSDIFTVSMIGFNNISKEPRLFSNMVTIKADYYGDNPSQDILDGNYGGRDDLPWVTKGPYIGSSIHVSFYQAYIGADLGNAYFISIIVDGVEKTPGGNWYRVSQSEQVVAWQPNRARNGISNPRGIITATPID